jgi:hypothetical protein
MYKEVEQILNLIFRNFKVDINIVGWIKDEGRIHQ